MKEAIYKKIEYISEKYIKTVLIGFKNQIRHMAAVVGNTLLKTFPEVLHHSPGSFPSNPQEIEDDV